MNRFNNIQITNYGAHRSFDSEEAARQFKDLFYGPEFGAMDLFFYPDAGKWYVTQYVSTPFTPLPIKEEGQRFQEGTLVLTDHAQHE